MTVNSTARSSPNVSYAHFLMDLISLTAAIPGNDQKISDLVRSDSPTNRKLTIIRNQDLEKAAA